MKAPGGTMGSSSRFDYRKEYARRQAMSPGPMTADITSYLKGAIQLPKIKN
jgi:hypothetical protein